LDDVTGAPCRFPDDVTGLTPQFALLAVLTTGVGVVMSRLGLRRGVLRLRQESRRCPSCSKFIIGYTCPDCGRPC